MLTTLRYSLRTAIALATVMGVTLVASPATAASTGDDLDCYAGGTSYGCTDPGTEGEPGDTGNTGGTGGGEPSAPTCDLPGAGGTDYSDQNRSPNFCVGENVCFNTDLLDLQDPPQGDPPTEGGEARVTWCYDGIMGPPSVLRIFWSDEEEPPSLLEQAREAIGNIDIGTPELQISPTGRTLVNLDTWYWLDGAEQEVTGSSAFGLVAIATFRNVTVDPGDGTGSFICPLVTTAAAAEKACDHEYRRASTQGSATVDGRAAYAASATTVYDLRFEVDGDEVDIDGAPATLNGPPAEAAVRVDEVQSRVTQLG